MSSKEEMLSRLAIPPEKKNRGNRGPFVMILAVVVVIAAGFLAYSCTGGQKRKSAAKPEPAAAGPEQPAKPPAPGDSVLTVSGYIIPRERIEISPKFQGTVEWIDIKKGDRVKKGDLLVRLQNEEFKARVLQEEVRHALALANLKNAESTLKRQEELSGKLFESEQALDNAVRARDAALAEVTMAQGALDLAQTYLNWCTIKAPIDGTILEKLVSPNELVTPQSFGGLSGPSTAFLAMADLNDLQVEIDISESDIAKVKLNQKCRIAPEAYPDKTYSGYVAEIAPQANRAKGTLQLKVQVEKPDAYMTPELTAKVDFLAE